MSRTEDALEQADLPLRPPEALFFYFAGVFVVALLGILLLPARPRAVLFVAALLPVALAAPPAQEAPPRLPDAAPDTLNLLSGSMRAGFSFAQGLETVANEAAEPTRRELQRVFTESRLGRPIEDALEDSANRMTSVDLMWAVMAIRIQREVGGNLAELLDTVADTMTQRERIRGEIKALTAEGRFSGGSSASSRSRSRACSTSCSPTTSASCSTPRWDSWPSSASRRHDRLRVPLAPQDPGDRGLT